MYVTCNKAGTSVVLAAFSYKQVFISAHVHSELVPLEADQDFVVVNAKCDF